MIRRINERAAEIAGDLEIAKTLSFQNFSKDGATNFQGAAHCESSFAIRCKRHLVGSISRVQNAHTGSNIPYILALPKSLTHIDEFSLTIRCRMVAVSSIIQILQITITHSDSEHQLCIKTIITMNAQRMPKMGHKINFILTVNQVCIRFFVQNLLAQDVVNDRTACHWLQVIKGVDNFLSTNDTYRFRRLLLILAIYGETYEPLRSQSRIVWLKRQVEDMRRLQHNRRAVKMLRRHCQARYGTREHLTYALASRVQIPRHYDSIAKPSVF